MKQEITRDAYLNQLVAKEGNGDDMWRGYFHSADIPQGRRATQTY